MTNLDSLDIYETHEGLRAISPAKVLKIAQENERLQANAVKAMQILAAVEFDGQAYDAINAATKLLSGEGTRPDEPTEKQAWYETHEPPHCPTCDCETPALCFHGGTEHLWSASGECCYCSAVKPNHDNPCCPVHGTGEVRHAVDGCTCPVKSGANYAPK